MGLSTNFGKSLLTTAYQIVSNSIKLGKGCSSDVYSILSARGNFYDGLCYSHNRRLSH